MKDIYKFISFLYSKIGWRIWVWLTFIILAALLDGLSVGFFIPILEAGDENNFVTREVKRFFDFLGISYSIITSVLFMAGLYSLRTVFLILQEIYSGRMVANLLATIKKDVVNGIFASDYLYFISKEIGYFNNAVTVEYNRVAFSFRACMRLFVSSGFALVYLILPLFINSAATILLLIILIPLYFVTRFINKWTRTFSLRTTKNNALLQSLLIQTFSNFKYLKSTHTTNKVNTHLEKAINTQSDLTYKSSVLGAFTGSASELIIVLVAAALLVYNVEFAGQSMIEVLLLLFLVRRSASYALSGYSDYRGFISAFGSLRVFENLEKDLVTFKEDSNKDKIDPDLSATLSFEDVGFSYDGKKQILEGINVSIPSKSIVAIVGESGSGKSTLASLITGVLTPEQGEIKISGNSYNKVDQEKLRTQIGYVTQENVIFTDSIRNNITLWDYQNVDSESKLQKVLVSASLTEFINDLDEGLDTQLGDNGLTISGGQRQRICIARELYRDIKMLILDEATSSLDSETESRIQSSIESLQGELTLVIVAHRLSTIRKADLILVISQGSIAESGKYEDLQSLGGIFSKMVKSQEFIVE
ncbi:MAG: ABC transporter ATP-binding protein [SAR202 cluster bacterium]|nr:ABC transporter ATP-binding protein [SAR202 cluster bacterium]